MAEIDVLAYGQRQRDQRRTYLSIDDQEMFADEDFLVGKMSRLGGRRGRIDGTGGAHGKGIATGENVCDRRLTCFRGTDQE